MTYKGWVPTITGRLSFSKIGTGDFPRKPKTWRETLPSERRIVVMQSRLTSDANLIFQPLSKLLNIAFDECGSFEFVLIARSNHHEKYEYISGFVLIFKEDKKRLLSKALEGICSHDLFQKVSNFSQFDPICKSEFRLSRNGKIVISTDLSDDEEAIVSPQIYFFIRDVVHKHQHHEDTSDTILEVYKDDAEFVWKRETQYALFRYIIESKRGKKAETFIRALGVSAYAESFSFLHLSTEDKQAIGEYLFMPTKHSLEAGMLEAERRENSTKSRGFIVDIIILYSLPIFGFFIGLFSIVPLIDNDLFSSNKDLPNDTLFILEYLATNPLRLLALCLLSGVFALIIKNPEQINKRFTTRQGLRIVFSLSPFWSRALITSLALFFMIIGVYVSFS